MEVALERCGGRPGTGSIPREDLRFDDPDEVTEALQPLAPGVRALSKRSTGFFSRIRAWSLSETPYFLYASRNGSAMFGEDRPYGAVTIPLFSSFGVRVGTRRLDVHDGRIHVLPPGVRGEIEPGDDALVLGFAVDWASFAKRRQAAIGGLSATGLTPDRPLSVLSECGERFLSHVDRLLRELNGSRSALRDARVAREVVDTTACLLAEVVCTSLAPREALPGESVARRAEEFLAENLESPVTLSDAAIVADVSTRTLLRAFQKRRGTSPMAFRRRRRFEAARRDLFLADPGETSVTKTAGRYCLDHLGRFATDYRALFGESPSKTLRN